MIFCKPKYSVCKECQVHFEPAPSDQKKWGDLCPEHRKPAIERDRKIQCAIGYAMENWEKVYEMYQEQYKSSPIPQVVLSQMATAQQAAMQPPYGSFNDNAQNIGHFGSSSLLGGK